MSKEKENSQLKDEKPHFLGNILGGEKYNLMKIILQGNIEETRGPEGRYGYPGSKNLRQWTGITSTESFRPPVNRIRLAMKIASIQ